MRLFPAAVLAAAILQGADMRPGEYLDYVKFLAAPEMRGRATGSRELERAADYIAFRFHTWGLKPLNGESYFQDFDVTTAARLGPANSLVWKNARRKGVLKLGRDFIPLNLSARGQASAQAVFAGYGITAPEYNYDDYAGLDVRDKIVVVLRHEPQEFDENSVFEGKAYTAHAQIFSKASNAKLHGAKAILIVNDLAAHKTSDASGEPADNDNLEPFGATAGPANAGIEIAQVKAAALEKWFAAAGKSLDKIESAIDRTLKPQSFEFPATLSAELNLDVERDIKKVHNVAAYFPGETQEYVVVGAHYDHLGLGEQFSLAPSLAGTVHAGADDNASGTAGVLELAHWFSEGPKRRRGVLFLAFAGEELGLLGSNYYVGHPDLPLESAVAMVNLDMIGRLRGNKVYVGGAGTGSTFLDLLKQAGPRHDIETDISDKAGYGSSDHTSFTTKQVPVLFFFSGLHADYHRPSDTWDKIDAPAAVKLLGLVGDVMSNLADSPTRPQFVRIPPDAPDAHSSAPAGSNKSGYGPDFGSIPDFTELPNGVRFADVRPGSPAAKAGLQPGDVLTEFGGKPVQNLYDFTYALRARKPGETVLVKVLRGGQTVEAKVLLTERK